MKSITQSFPPMPLSELVPAIREFDLQSIQWQLDFLASLVSIHPTFNVNWRVDRGYFRARTISSENNPQSVNETIWRKSQSASPGRANPEGFSVLYLGNRPETCFCEIGAHDHDVLIAEFGTRAEKSTNIAPIGEFAHIFASSRGRLIGDTAREFARFMNACDYTDLKSLIITDSFLQRRMALDAAPYTLSSHIAHCIFRKNAQIRCIAYESTKLPGAMNFAIRTEDFWQSWGLCSASTLHVSHLAEGLYAESNRRNVKAVDVSGVFSWGQIEANERVVYDLNYWFPR